MSFFVNKGGSSGGGGSGGGNITIESKPTTFSVNTIADRNALAAGDGYICLVFDASSDSTVGNGFAVYQYFNNKWIKTSDARMLALKDEVVSLQNRVNTIEIELEDATLIHRQTDEPSRTDVLWLED